MVGERFGRLVVLEMLPRARVRCKCDCGAISEHRRWHLKVGATSSCGCFRKEHSSETKSTHGLSGAAEYKIWKGIIKRCENPHDHAFANYSGRGIRIAPEWRNDFESFIAHVGPRPSAAHSIDRINNDRSYEPGNVRWATKSEQAANRRSSRLIVAFCQARILRDWACITGLSADAIYARMRLGWPVERALTAPLYARRVS